MKIKDRIGDLHLIRLVNKQNTQLEILNYGATVYSLTVAGVNVIVGPSRPEDYLSAVYHTRGKYFGATVGRHAGRISHGGFKINSEKFSLFEKEGIHLHGGNYGFSYKFWKVIETGESEDPFVILEYLSPDGEEGYPGDLRVRVKYTLTEENEVKVDYSAVTSKTTVVNITNHSYFNLNGSGPVDDHVLQIPADEYLETTSRNVPTGRLLETAGTPFDFRKPVAIGKVPLDTVFKFRGGEERISITGKRSGLSLQITTNQPAVVVYVPENLPNDWEYSTAIAFERAAICFETQKFPDAPHQPHFPKVTLEPDKVYNNYTTWKFKTGS